MKRLIIKLTVMLVIVSICVVTMSEFTRPKWVSGSNPQTYQFSRFEELEPNTIDVLAMGSCQVYQGFNTAVLWERAGLTSYVLASPDQRFYSTYHLLKNALKTQSPKILLIDALMLTEPNDESRGYDSKVLYSIDDTDERLELADEIFELHYKENKALPQYYCEKLTEKIKTVFPVFTFCSTFDFSSDYVKYYTGSDTITYNGSVPVYIRMDITPKSAYMTENCKGNAKIDANADLYFRKVVELCRENGIEIVLFKTVSQRYWSNEKHEIIADYAADFGIDYIDFNVDPESFGFDLSTDMFERWKMNADGMCKTTEILAEHITEKYPELSDSEKSASVISYYDSMLARYKKAYESAQWKTVELSEDTAKE